MHHTRCANRKEDIATACGFHSRFQLIAGQRLYIPGYGFAVVGDIGGGYIIENKLGISRTRWIDLGFDDNNLVDMTGWVTVYFLAPPPVAIPDFLK